METLHSFTCRAMKLVAKFLSPWNLLESRVPRHHNHHDCHKLLNLTLSLHHTMSLRQLKNFEHIADDWNDKRRCLLDPSEDECFSPPLPLHQMPCHHPVPQCQLLPGLLILMALGPTLNHPKKKTISVSELGNLGHGFSAFDIDDLEHTALPLDGMWKMATSFSATPPKTTGK
jgi:hypothetical protein